VIRSSLWTRGLACAIAIALAYLVTPALFDLDDAYIALHGAAVAVRGEDAVYGAPALAGATSPAYVGLLIGALLAGFEGLHALRLVSALGLVAYAFALLQLGRTLDLPARRQALLLVLTLGSGLVLMQATNGLETGWALALTTALIAAARRARHRRRRRACISRLLVPRCFRFSARSCCRRRRCFCCTPRATQDGTTG
jgi:hypothetical protein